MKNDAYFTTLRTSATELAKSLLQPEEFVTLKSDDCLIAYCAIAKVNICKRCLGSGIGKRRGYSCFNCQGKGHLGTTLPDVAEVEAIVTGKQNSYAKRLLTIVKRAQAKIQKVEQALQRQEEAREAQRQNSVAFLDAKQLKLFNEAIAEGTGPFIESIKTQWKVWGKLSEAQVNAVLSSYHSQRRQVIEAEFYNEYSVGQVVTVKGKIVSIKEDYTVDMMGRQALITKISIKAHSQQQFSINTTSSKLINQLEALRAAGTWFTVTATVKWIADNKKYISLSAKGLKINV